MSEWNTTRRALLDAACASAVALSSGCASLTGVKRHILNPLTKTTPELMPLPKNVKMGSGFVVVPERLRALTNLISPRLLSAAADALDAQVEQTDSDDDACLVLLQHVRMPALYSVPRNLAQEGYELNVRNNAIRVEALSERGLFYGLQTLRQLRCAGGRLPCCRIADWPDMAFRGVHMTLGGGGYTFDTLCRAITRLAALKINTIVIEYDDRFPWDSHPLLPQPGTLSKPQLRKVLALAEANYVEVVPLLDSLGHAKPYLRHKAYAHLSELPDSIDEMCPSNPLTLRFIKELWSEVLDLHPTARYAHITGDEVFRLGDFCPKCKAYEQKGRLAHLFTKYYTELSRWILANGRTPMVWGDMLVKFPQDIANFPRDIIINDWCYLGIDADNWFRTIGNYGYFTRENLRHVDPAILQLFQRYWIQPSTAPDFTPFPNLKFFLDQGFQVIGCAAASGGGAANLLPSPSQRWTNAKRFAESVARERAMGFLNTFWGGAEAFESAWYGLCAGADYSWHSRPEPQPRFTRRFAKVFLDAPASQAGILAVVDALLYPPQRGFVQKAGKIGTRPPRMRAGRNAEYAALLDVAGEAGELHSRLRRLADDTAGLVAGSGRTEPVSLAHAANADFNTCTPLRAAPLAMAPGRHVVHGIAFDILDPARNRGRSVVALRGGRYPSGAVSACIPVGGRTAASLYFLWTAVRASPPSHLADVVVRYGDGTTEIVPVAAGTNIADWWSNPTPTTDAFVAWEGGGDDGKTRTYAYMAPWSNPRPDAPLASVELRTTDTEGHVILAALSLRRQAVKAPDARTVTSLLRAARAIRSKIDLVRGKAEAAYARLFSKPDAQTAAQRLPLDRMRRWCDVCEAHLRRLRQRAVGAGGVGAGDDCQTGRPGLSCRDVAAGHEIVARPTSQSRAK